MASAMPGFLRTCWLWEKTINIRLIGPRHNVPEVCIHPEDVVRRRFRLRSWRSVGVISGSILLFMCRLRHCGLAFANGD